METTRPSPLVLYVTPDEDGGWMILLGTPESQPVRAYLAPTDVAALRREVDEALRPRAVAIQGHVARMEQAEERAGRALGRVFAGTVMARRLGEHQGLALARRGGLTLAIDSADPDILGLPWELLAGPGEPPLEEGGGIVVRLAAGRVAGDVAVGRGLRILCWCPPPRDAACLDVVERLRAAGTVRMLDDDLQGGLPAAEEGRVDVLAILCHGDASAEGTVLQFGAGDGGPSAVVPALRASLGRLGAVLLGVCGGGAESWQQLGDLSGRLLLSGAPVVVSTPVPVRADAFAAFSQGFLEQLSRGETLDVACRSGRQAVRALRIPHPDSRPSSFRLQVGNLRRLGMPVLTRAWRPEGWPMVTEELEALLARARADGEREGWVGLEHLLDAWAPTADFSGDFRRQLVGWGPGLRSELREGLRSGGVGGSLRTTPRLARLGSALPAEGASLRDLSSALIEDPTSALHLLAQRPLDGLHWDPLGSMVSQVGTGIGYEGDPGTPARRFEVLWGPEDGRKVTLEPGQTLGRWHREAIDAVTLYAGMPVIDWNLRRGHLRYLGPGAIELHYGARVVRRGEDWRASRETTGIQQVDAGDLVLLTRGTWLRGLG